MKKILFALMLTAISMGAFAQDKKDNKMAGKSMDKMDHKMKDCVMMENGKMTVMKGGESMDMNEDMTMSNGTTVMKDGTVKMKNGTTKMLKDGQCVYMDGKMGMMNMHKNMKMKKDKM